MKQSYQSYHNLINSNESLAKKKEHNDKLARMKASGTYCDSEDPDLSFLNLKPSCKQCPNHGECKEASEKRSQDILKYRRKSIKKPKTKRNTKGCGCK